MNETTIPPQAILFDLDGLMAESEPLAEWAWNQFLARYGCQLSDQMMVDILGMRVIDSAELICQRFQLPVDPEKASDQRDEIFLDAVPQRLQPCPGLASLLDELAERGIPLAVATSGHRRYATLALRTLGVADYFEAMVTGNEVEHGKPAPDIFLLAAERLGVPPARCVVLEDSPLGVAAAREAGMLVIAIPNQRIPPQEFSEAHLVFSSLQEVHQALDNLLELDLRILDRWELKHYSAAGGVVVCQDQILVLQRPSREEVRLPKGRIEPGESPQTTALREVYEESGYADPEIQADLGAQIVTFEHNQRRVLRVERYFLMELSDSHRPGSSNGEEQFDPVWLSWDQALATLTFEAEREWVRRARSVHRAPSAGRE